MKNIQKIDKLLEDDIELKKYLENIEKKETEIPIDLKENIIIKIEKKKKNYLLKISKIAACLIFCLAICRTDFIKEDQFNKNQNKNTKDNTVIEQKISDFCKIFTTPINLGGND